MFDDNHQKNSAFVAYQSKSGLRLVELTNLLHLVNPRYPNHLSILYSTLFLLFSSVPCL